MTRTLPFTKMHGLGNDYVFVGVFGEAPAETDAAWEELARRISDRRTGVGSDGLIALLPASAAGAASGASLRMRIWNADGSEAEMCGNGVRCAARLAAEEGWAEPRQDAIAFETGAGTVRVALRRGPGGAIDGATVDMGPPVFDPARIPVDHSRLAPPIDPEGVRRREARVGEWDAAFVSMGNPHMVAFRGEPVESVDLAALGPVYERHPAFPRRINVHVVNVLSRTSAAMRSWERGAGLTAACGTGACAVLAAGVMTGRLDREATIRLPGGELRVRWDETTGRIFKSGPAARVFDGEWPL